MAELVTIYKAIPEDVSRIVGLLQSRHLHPVVLDDAGKLGAYRNQTHEIRIAVPETERDMALGILAETEQKDGARLRPLINVTNAIVLLVIAVLGFVAVVGLLDTSGKWFAAVWIVLTAVVAVALIRWAWRKKPKA